MGLGVSLFPVFPFKVVVSLSNIKEEFWKVVSLVGYQVEVLIIVFYEALAGLLPPIWPGTYQIWQFLVLGRVAVARRNGLIKGYELG